MPSEDSSLDETCPCGHALSHHSGAYCLGCIHTCQHQHPDGWADSAADEMCGVCGHPRAIHSIKINACLLCWDETKCSHTFEAATQERAAEIEALWRQQEEARRDRGF